jgi:pimeloyl-ACP methyl ester carboxylesterase
MNLVLLHGLARTERTMRSLGELLSADGHVVHALPYPSRAGGLDSLARGMAASLDKLGLAGGGDELGFVAHSMGGLVLRALPRHLSGFRCGRCVLLGSPINGSIVAERFGNHPALRAFYGPALADLAPSRVRGLPGVPGPFGVIAGTRWTPLVPAATLLAVAARGERSDSTVLVRETRDEAMADFVEVPYAHSFLADRALVQRQVAYFLRNGVFERR